MNEIIKIFILKNAISLGFQIEKINNNSFILRKKLNQNYDKKYINYLCNSIFDLN